MFIIDVLVFNFFNPNTMTHLMLKKIYTKLWAFIFTGKNCRTMYRINDQEQNWAVRNVITILRINVISLVKTISYS